MGKEFYTAVENSCKDKAVENSCKDKELNIKAGEGQDVKELSGRMTKSVFLPGSERKTISPPH